MTPEAIRWWDAHPVRFQMELDSMSELAPDLKWDDTGVGGGWVGRCPIWPFDRPAPQGLVGFLDGQRLEVDVRLSPAHPAVAPTIYPITPQPDVWVRTRQEWHVLGDGGLCLMRETLDWSAAEPAAELVRKAAGWFLEFLLLRDNKIERMTEQGIVKDEQLDQLFIADTTPPP